MKKVQLYGSEQIGLLPESWEEVTLSTYIRLQQWDRFDIRQLLALITGLPHLDYSNKQTIELLAGTFLEFMTKEIDFSDYTIDGSITIEGKKVLFDLDLSNYDYQINYYIGKELAACEQIESSYPFVIASVLYKSWSGKKWDFNKVVEFEKVVSELPVLDALPLAEHFIQENIKLNTQWNDQLKDITTSEQKRAGIDKLQRFGNWSLVYNLANNDILKMDEVMRVPYSRIFTALLYNQERTLFERRLQKQFKK